MDDMPDIDMDDLQAAIDASAHATVEKKKKPSSSVAKESKTAPVKVAAAVDPQPEETPLPVSPEVASPTPTSVVDADSEDTTVTVSVTESASEPEPIATESTEHTIAVTVGSAPRSAEPEAAVEEPQAEVSEPQEITVSSHKGRTIMPRESNEPIEEVARPTEKPRPAPSTQDIIPVMRKTEQLKDDAVTPTAVPVSVTPPSQEMPAEEAPIAQEAPKTEVHERRIEPLHQGPVVAKEPAQPEAYVKAEEPEDGGLEINTTQHKLADDAPAPEKDTKDDAKHIFNSKEYHLPIKANRHHRKGQLRPLQVFAIVFIILAAVGGFAAVDENFRNTITGGLLDNAEVSQEN